MRIDLSKAPQLALFVIALPILSVLLVFILNYLLHPLAQEWYFPLIDSLGFFGAYGFLYTQFNSRGWQWLFFRYLGVVNFPNLNGRWKGTIISSYDSRNSKIATFLEIRQTFSDVFIDMYTEKSRSTSLIADFIKAKNDQIELHYEYSNEPNEKADTTMHGHNGVVRLTYLEDKGLLKGSYYNANRHERGHIGSLEFRFQGKNLLRRF